MVRINGDAGMTTAEKEAHARGRRGHETGAAGTRRFVRAQPSATATHDQRPGALTATQLAVLAREARYRRALAVADIVAVCVSVGSVATAFGLHFQVWVLILPAITVLGCKVVGLYDRDEDLLRKGTLDEAPSLFQVATLYSLLAWCAGGIVFTQYLGRPEVFTLWVLLFVLLLSARALARQVVRSFSPPERCLVVGDAESAERLAHRLNVASGLKATIVGLLPVGGDQVPPLSNVPVLGDLEDLGWVVERHRVHRVVLVPRDTNAEEALELIGVVEGLGVKVSVLPGLFEVVGSSVRFDQVDGVTLLGVPRFGLSRSSFVLKRQMDVLGAALALVLLAPVLAGIAIAVKLSSRGPILFKQVRIGRRGRQFQLLKFRTMQENAEEMKTDLLPLNEADGLFKIADDPRVTRVGRFLRQASLDELPQLVNVLRGDMSLVGPRPLIGEEDEQVIGWHRRRLDLKPGMTGLWQIYGSSRIPLREMVKIDYLYVGNWSVWLDVKTLLRTVPYVLGRRGL